MQARLGGGKFHAPGGRLRRPLAAARAPHPAAPGPQVPGPGPLLWEAPPSRQVSGRCHTSHRAGAVFSLVLATSLREMLSANQRKSGDAGIVAGLGGRGL